MDLIILKQVNRLWHRIYPYLAKQIMEICPKNSGKVLELGPFSCGISVAMMRHDAALDITVADEDPDVVEYLSEEIKAEGLSAAIRTTQTTYDPLAFDDGEFDLVVCRGVFFFLDDQGRLFQEISRVLNEDGMAFVGGGFGKDTPVETIHEISDESRRLNDLLGRKRFTVEELESIIARAGLADNARIVKDGGLWVLLDKS